MAKRERERARQQRQEAKRLKRETVSTESHAIEASEEARLMEEFRLLSERHAAGDISESRYTTERNRILVELRLEHPRLIRANTE
jgi:uncharacterized membrane protein